MDQQLSGEDINMAKIVEGLFGLTPSQVEQKQAMEQEKRATMLAGLAQPNFAQLSYGISNLGYGLGQMAGQLLGVEDPELTKAKDMSMIQADLRKTLTNEEMMNPEIYFPHVVKALDEKGYGTEASQLQAFGQQEILAYRKTQAEIARADRAEGIKNLTALKKAKLDLKEAQAKLALDPTNDLLKQDVADYQAAVDKLTKDKELTLQQRVNKATAVLADKDATKDEKEDAQDFINQVKASEEGMTYDAEENRFKHIKGSPKYNEAKGQAVQQMKSAVGKLPSLQKVSNSIKKAINQVTPFTAGVGSLLSVLPGTEAANLQKTIDEIIANIGFDRLQRMREESPTGGALGQVAVKELKMLQATLGSLDTRQSVGQLKDQLTLVLNEYERAMGKVQEEVDVQYDLLKSEFPEAALERPNLLTIVEPIKPEKKEKKDLKSFQS